MKSVTKIRPTVSVTHGYARCSTNEEKQDIDRQTRELKRQGADKIWLEFEHGDAASKEQQALMLDTASPGDTIITLEVSRLARSTKQLCEIIDVIRDKQLRLVIVGSITMDCRDGSPDPMTEAFLQIAGVFSQLELSMIRARVKSGMANAKAKGKRIGRPPVSAESIPNALLSKISGREHQPIGAGQTGAGIPPHRISVHSSLDHLEAAKNKVRKRASLMGAL